MDARRFEALIQDLGKAIEVPAVEADVDGHCGLVFDDLVVHIVNDPRRRAIKLFGSPGRVDENAPPEALSRLLAANRFWAGTGGATLGWDPQSREVQLAYAVPAGGLDGEGLAGALEHFLYALDSWRTRLAEWSRGEFGSPARLPDEALRPLPGGVLQV